MRTQFLALAGAVFGLFATPSIAAPQVTQQILGEEAVASVCLVNQTSYAINFATTWGFEGDDAQVWLAPAQEGVWRLVLDEQRDDVAFSVAFPLDSTGDILETLTVQPTWGTERTNDCASLTTYEMVETRGDGDDVGFALVLRADEGGSEAGAN